MVGDDESTTRGCGREVVEENIRKWEEEEGVFNHSSIVRLRVREAVKAQLGLPGRKELLFAVRRK